MPTLHRAGLLFLALAAPAAVLADQGASPVPPPPTVDPLFLPYEQVGVMAPVGAGQTIHLKCMGKGSPTVILTAGMGGWSSTWRAVQPQMAARTRTCAWDRPGFGFSSGTAAPQSVVTTATALQAALKRGKIGGPYVVVGHSLGAYRSLLLKDRNPRGVVGMVLVDPSFPDQSTVFGRLAPAIAAMEAKMTAGAAARAGRCVAGLRAGKVKAGADPDQCLATPPNQPPALRQALSSANEDPMRHVAIKSFLEAVPASGRAVVSSRRNYGAMPLIVLTATREPELPPGAPKLPPEEAAAFTAAWRASHVAYARLSTRGINRLVPDAAHNIQFDQPGAVIAAVAEVVAAAVPVAGPVAVPAPRPKSRSLRPM